MTATTPNIKKPHIPLCAALFLLLLAHCATCGAKNEANAKESARRSAYIPIQSIRKEARELEKLLLEYYDGKQLMQDTWYLPTVDQGAGKADQTQNMVAGLDYMANKMARAIVWKDKFVIGTIGSSVVAGTANCRYDTYQEQLLRTTAAMWEAAHVKFEIRNAGIGGGCGDSHRNQIWCTRQLVGDDVDIIHYSWTYFEAGDNANVAKYHEMFYRWSLLMPNSPIPQLVYTSDCSKFNKQDKALLSQYGQFGTNALCMQRGLVKAGYQRGENGSIGDSLHTTTRYGEDPATSTTRRNSLGVVFRNWHPGPLLFQTTADAMAYQYTKAILLALDKIEAEANPRERWPRKLTQVTADQLPPVQFCDPEWCDSEGPPSCLNYEIPTYGKAQIERISATDPRYPFPSESTPRHDWVYWQGNPNRSAPKAERNMPQCDLLDRCAGLKPNIESPTSPLVFDLPTQERGFIALCCAGKQCTRSLLQSGPTFYLDTRPVNYAPEQIWEGKCLQLRHSFDETFPHSVRTLIVEPGSSTENMPPITHVLVH